MACRQVKRITPIFWNNSNPRRWWWEIGFTPAIKHATQHTTRRHDMNAVYLTQAEPLLRGAHAATIKQDDRDALRLIHSAMLRFMRGQGIFMAEIPADKASKTRAPGGDPLTPDPACPHCDGKGYHGAKSVFDRCICTYGSGPVAEPARRVVMDEDDAREKDMREKLFTLQSENDAWRADSQTLADIHAALDVAMPGFKGTASTPEWTVAAVRELLHHNNTLVAALKDTLAPLQDAQNQLHHTKAAAAFINARQAIKHNETLRGQS